MNDENNNPLDLNNLPHDFSTARDNARETQFEAGSSTSGQSSRKKKKKKDDESGRVYECRFCSLKFCKSQALGGHMNRHRQERETETLNKARMLVFSNENNIHGLPAHHLGGQPVGPNGGFHQPVIDPTLQFRPAYQVQPMRLPSSSQSSTVIQHQNNNPYLYTSSPRPHFVPSYHTSNDSIDHFLGTTGPETANYACIGTPVEHRTGFGRSNGVRENGTSSVHSSVTNGHHHDDGLNWEMRGFGRTSHQQLQPATRLDLSSSSNRFQDGL